MLLFDPEQVSVVVTDTSKLSGTHHVIITLGGVASDLYSLRLQTYLIEQPAISPNILGIYNEDTRVFMAEVFVFKHLACDAASHVRGLFGPQAHAFA